MRPKQPKASSKQEIYLSKTRWNVNCEENDSSLVFIPKCLVHPSMNIPVCVYIYEYIHTHTRGGRRLSFGGEHTHMHLYIDIPFYTYLAPHVLSSIVAKRTKECGIRIDFVTSLHRGSIAVPHASRAALRGPGAGFFSGILSLVVIFNRLQNRTYTRTEWASIYYV